MITRFHVENYKALRDVTLDLTPIHVLIGPNDSGKTSILEALAALCRSVDHTFANAFVGTWTGAELVSQGSQSQQVTLDASWNSGEAESKYQLVCQFQSAGRNATNDGEVYESLGLRVDLTRTRHNSSTLFQTCIQHRELGESQKTCVEDAIKALRGVHYYRWVPRFLAMPVALDKGRSFRMESDGFGLAQCLDDINGVSRRLFDQLEEKYRGVFPHVETVELRVSPGFNSPVDDSTLIPSFNKADGKGIYVRFKGSSDPIPASQLSDGLLLVLAYLAILYLPDPPRVLLIEEPENGVHPSRLKEVLGILKGLVQEQSHTQVIMTTHSPYVLDQFSPEEVTLCRREDDGSVSVHRLSESETVRKQMSVFTLGEIWTGEGDDALAGKEPATKDRVP